MPQFAPLTLADGQATPVSRTFSVTSLEGGLAAYADRSIGAIQAQPRVTLKVAANARPTGVNRAVLTIAVPYVDVSSGTVSIARFNGEFLLPNTIPQSTRDDIYAFAKNLIANTVVADMSKKVEGLY